MDRFPNIRARTMHKDIAPNQDAFLHCSLVKDAIENLNGYGLAMDNGATEGISPKPKTPHEIESKSAEDEEAKTRDLRKSGSEHLSQNRGSASLDKSSIESTVSKKLKFTKEIDLEISSKFEDNSIQFEDSEPSANDSDSQCASARFLKDSNTKTFDSNVVLPANDGQYNVPNSGNYFANFDTWNRNKPDVADYQLQAPFMPNENLPGDPPAISIRSQQFEPDESIMDVVLRNFDQDSCDPSLRMTLERMSEADMGKSSEMRRYSALTADWTSSRFET